MKVKQVICAEIVHFLVINVINNLSMACYAKTILERFFYRWLANAKLICTDR